MDLSAEQTLMQLKADFQKLIELKYNLFKLNTYESISRVVAIIIVSFLIGVVAFALILFFFLFLAYFLGDLLHSVVWGFGIVTLFYFVLGILVVAFRKKIQLSVMNAVIRVIMAKENQKDDTTG